MNGRHRTWSNIENRYIDKDTQVLIMDDGIPVELKGDGFLWPIDGVDVEYYTGLRDKNGAGKEVYDGDVFPRLGIVRWSRCGWIVQFDYHVVPLNEYLFNDPTRETIGNIHENTMGDV